MASFRFLHTADIHLESPLLGLAGQEGNLSERIRGAPREAFDTLIGQAAQENVNFVVISGDLYDGRRRQRGRIVARPLDESPTPKAMATVSQELDPPAPRDEVRTGVS